MLWYDLLIDCALVTAGLLFFNIPLIPHIHVPEQVRRHWGFKCLLALVIVLAAFHLIYFQLGFRTWLSERWGPVDPVEAYALADVSVPRPARRDGTPSATVRITRDMAFHGVYLVNPDSRSCAKFRLTDVPVSPQTETPVSGHYRGLVVDCHCVSTREPPPLQLDGVRADDIPEGAPIRLAPDEKAPLIDPQTQWASAGPFRLVGALKPGWSGESARKRWAEVAAVSDGVCRIGYVALPK